MDGKHKVENTVFGGGATLGVLGSLVVWLLNALGWLEMAQSLEGVTSLYANPAINWPGVWMVVLVICAAGLLVTNYQTFASWRRAVEHAKQRTWDAPVEYVIRYIADESWSGQASRGNEARYDHALSALQEAAEHGSIKVAGKKQGSSTLSEVPTRAFRRAKLSPSDSPSNPPKVLVLKQADKLLYRELFVDTREMKTFWNRKGGVSVRV